VKRNFIVLFTRGGGSSFLAESLNQIPGTLCLREPSLGCDFFNNDEGLLLKLQKHDDTKYRRRTTQRIMDCKWIGAKLKLHDQVSLGLEKKLLNSNVPIVICLRNDVVSHAVGLCRKDISKGSITWNKSEKLNSCYISPVEFEKNLEFVLESNKKLFNFYKKIAPSRRYYVFYEDLCYNLETEVSGIMRFINSNQSTKIEINKKSLPLKVTSLIWMNSVNNFKEVGDKINAMNLSYNQMNSGFTFLPNK